MDEFISGALGALIGAFIACLTLRYNYRDLYARSISKSRMEWISNFREEVSVIIAALNIGISQKKHKPQRSRRRTEIKKTYNTNNGGYILEAEKARAKLLMRLNMDTAKSGNEYNGVFAKLLKQIDFQKPENNGTAEQLVELSQKILEYEWKRVKREAGGEKR